MIKLIKIHKIRIIVFFLQIKIIYAKINKIDKIIIYFLKMNKSINQLRNNKINKIIYLDNKLKVIKIMLNLKIRIIEIKHKIIYLGNNLKIINIMLSLKIREIKLRIIKINRDNRIIFLIKNSLNKNK